MSLSTFPTIWVSVSSITSALPSATPISTFSAGFSGSTVGSWGVPTTTTEQEALLSPTVAVITALPAETAVSNPFGATVATAVLSDEKLTVLSASAPASTVACSIIEPPSARVTSSVSNATEKIRGSDTLPVAAS